MTRVLVVTYDQVGPRMAGPAIRAFELSRVLAREHEVVLACRHEPGRPGDGFDVRFTGADRGAMLDLVDWADVVVAFGFLLVEFPEIVERRKVVVADVYDPFPLEVLVQRAGDPFDVQVREHRGALRAMEELLRKSDFFLVASQRQHDLVFGMLCALNRVSPTTAAGDQNLEQLLAVVPFGLPSEAAVAPEPVLRGVRDGFEQDDLVLLWAGGIYEWFDPLSLVRGLAELAAPDVKLLFLGTRHPNPEVPEMAMSRRVVELAEELGLRDRTVFFNDDWVPYEDRVAYLLESDVGVSTHFRHVETAYAFRTRMLDYIWTGLPVLCTEGDTLADLVSRLDLGEVVPAEDPAAVARAVERLLDPDRRQRCSANLLELSDRLRWDVVAEPLLRFCREPRHAADRADGHVPRTPLEEDLLTGLEAELEGRRSELEHVHAELFRLKREREGFLREIDELEAFREKTLDSLPYRLARRVRGG